MQKIKTIDHIIPAIRTTEGEGFVVRRPFPTNSLDHIDPFLLLDEMGPMQTAPGAAKGAPDHPHRGFETVTYMLSGAMQHKDSQGNVGHIGPGDVQWMTAGSGVIHSELPEESFQKTGGIMHGIQLWVNLPKIDKMMKPRYQDLNAQHVPQIVSPDRKVEAKIIAGEFLGISSHIETRIPITYLHLKIQPGGQVKQSIPQTHNSFAYLLKGSGNFGEEQKPAYEGDLVLFKQDGDIVQIQNPKTQTEEVELLLLAGQPLNETVVRYGPFVMNTEEEIYQAITDFRRGQFGEISR